MYVGHKNTNLQNVPPPFCKLMSGHNIFDIYFHLPPQRAVPCHGEEPHAAAARRRRTPPPHAAASSFVARCRSPPPLPAAAAAATHNRRSPYSAAAVADAFAGDNGETASASATSPPWAPRSWPCHRPWYRRERYPDYGASS
jgi:hypothetical protein